MITHKIGDTIVLKYPETIAHAPVTIGTVKQVTQKYLIVTLENCNRDFYINRLTGKHEQGLEPDEMSHYGWNHFEYAEITIQTATVIIEKFDLAEEITDAFYAEGSKGLHGLPYSLLKQIKQYI